MVDSIDWIKKFQEIDPVNFNEINNRYYVDPEKKYDENGRLFFEVKHKNPDMLYDKL